MINGKTSEQELTYLIICGTPKEKALAKAERERRTGDMEGGESMTQKKTKAVAVKEVEVSPAKEKVGKIRETFKVRSKGDLGVPQRIASECGITSGMKFTCVPTDNRGEVLVKVVDIGGGK
jgi:hypothetical protein